MPRREPGARRRLARGDDDRPQARSAAPAPPLRGLVAYHGYDLDSGAPGRHRGLPSPYLTFIVTLREPLTMREADGRLARRDTVLGGLHTSPVEIVHDGRQAGVHVVLDPRAARRLLGVPAAALHAVDLEADDLLGPAGREIHERVGEADGWSARFAAIDDVLSRRLAEPGAIPAELTRAWRTLARGGTGVRDAAAQVGWSDRHLGQRFRAEFGVGPKVAARMGRFDRARRRIADRAVRGAALGLAEVAAEGGFADQAHLTREFSAMAGCPPTRWVAEEIANIQDAPPPDAESSTP